MEAVEELKAIQAQSNAEAAALEEEQVKRLEEREAKVKAEQREMDAELDHELDNAVDAVESQISQQKQLVRDCSNSFISIFFCHFQSFMQNLTLTYL